MPVKTQTVVICDRCRASIKSPHALLSMKKCTTLLISRRENVLQTWTIRNQNERFLCPECYKSFEHWLCESRNV